MKILQQTSTELTVGQKPPRLAWGLFLAIFLLIGLLFVFGILGSLNPTKLLCKQATEQRKNSEVGSFTGSVSCVIIKLDERGTEISKTPIFRLKEAKLETELVTGVDPANRSDQNERVILLTDRGKIPFKFSHYGGSEQLIISKINAFMSNPLKTSFEITDDAKSCKYLMVAIGSIIILYGFIGFSSIARIPPNVICKLDQESKRMTIKYSEEKVLQPSLEEIADIRVEEWENTYRVSFILISGESLPLTYVYSSSRKEKQQIADCIREFLG